MRLEAKRVQSSRDILAVLPAAGIRAVGRRDEEEGVIHPVSAHDLDRVLQQGMPVAVPEVDGQVNAVLRQLSFERGDQRSVLGVDRTDAAEMCVVLGDFFEPLPWDVTAAGDVFQKGHDVVHALRATE